MKQKVKAFFTAARTIICRNLGLKLLSLVIALLLWNMVISQDTSLTRSKTIAQLSGSLSGLTALESAGLALAADPFEELTGVSVILEVAQADYAYASADNVQVTLDVSGVRAAGSQEVRLRATTAYGKVKEIVPATVTLNFEPRDARAIPVNVKLVGDMSEDTYYALARANPATINVSGAASVVQSIAAAYVYADVTGREDSYISAEPFVLQDGEGGQISQSMLYRSSSSITVSMGVYPTRELPVSTNAEDVLTGQAAEGYEITGVTIQPETVTVAADAELLDGLNQLLVEPVSVEGATQSFSARASIDSLTDFKYVSSEQVYVNVAVAEKTISAWIDNVNVTFVGKDESLELTWQRESLATYVTGPKSAVNRLAESGLSVACDLTGLSAGDYTLTLDYGQNDESGLSFEPATAAVKVTLSPITPNE